METLHELINKHCPDGVEYLELSKILNYEQPSKYIVHSTDYDDSYEIPVLTAGQSFILGYTNETEGVYKAAKDDPTIIFDDFTTSFHWVNFDFKVKSSAMKMLKPNNEVEVNFRFVFYAMKCIEYKPKEHSRQWISNYSKFKIPVPPIEVQNEIVKILDNFTELAAELQAELQARKLQYEYYRNKLLSFNELNRGGQAVKWLKMSEIFDIRNGYTPSKNNPAFWDGGTIPWFRMEDIRTNGRILSDSIQHITPAAIKGKGLFKANSIIVATTATIGEHALIIADSLANQQFTNLQIRKSLEKELDMKFFFYYMFIVDDWCKSNVNVSGFASVDMTKFKNLLIPIPPMDEQLRVVEILDQFEELVNGIREGLPAEIDARQKQYEYYRNKLMTFKDISNGKVQSCS